MSNRKIIPSNIEDIRKALDSGLRIKIERIPSLNADQWKIDRDLDSSIDIGNIYLSKITKINEMRSALVFDHIKAGAVLSLNQDDILNFNFYFYPTQESEDEIYREFASKAIKEINNGTITGYTIEKGSLRIRARCKDGYDHFYDIDTSKTHWLKLALDYFEELKYITLEIKQFSDLDVVFRDDIIEIQLASRSIIKKENDFFNDLIKMDKGLLYKIFRYSKVTIKGDKNA